MPRSLKKGPFVDDHLLRKVVDGERSQQQERDQDLVAPLDDHPGHARATPSRCTTVASTSRCSSPRPWSGTSSASSAPTRTFRGHEKDDKKGRRR